MRKLTFLLACLFLIGIGLVNAQSKSISGKVISADDGQPVIGASVKVKEASVGTITNTDGGFKINMPASAKTLVVKYIGMKTTEVEAVNNMLIKLEASNTQMREVEVITTALGIKRQEREIGYAATTLKNKLITQANATNVQQALNGKVSGLNITTTNSGVFEDSKINIRGIRSLTGNNQPLLILDGAPVSMVYLSSIAPEDIQDVTVLKSGASAAVYGPDAVNGVILVTTKKGDSEKMTVSVTSSLQASRVAYFPKLQKEFGGGAGELQDEFGNYLVVPYENQQYGPRFDGSIQEIGIHLQDGSVQTGPYDNKHYQDKIKFWNTGLTFQNAISLSSKDFMLSVTNANIKGLMPDDKNDRTTLRFNSGKEYKKFSISYNLNYTNTSYNITNEDAMPDLTESAYNGSIFSQILQIPNNVPLLSYRDLNSKWGKFENYFNEFAMNPYWMIANLRKKGANHDFIGNVDMSYKFTKWLKADIKGSSNLAVESYTTTNGPIYVSDWTLAHRDNTSYHNQPGKVFTNSYIYSRLNIEAFLSGELSADDFNFKYLVGTTLRSTQSKDISVGGNDLSVPELYNVSVRSGDAYVPDYADEKHNSTIVNRLQSAYGNITIGYKKLAYLELTGRNDWDSRLLKKNRSIFYPGANLSFMMTDILPELKDNSISYLKLRASVNKSGNVNINPYSTQATYTQSKGFPFGSYVGYSANNTIPNPNLLPEFVVTTEGGFDLGLIEDRIRLDATFFNQACKNQILQVSQSWATGYPTSLANAADFRNYGVEMDLTLTPLVKIGNGNFNLKVNATYNNNEVTATQNETPVVLIGTDNFIQQAASSPTVNNIAIVGQPAFAFQLTDYVRDPKTGKVIVDAKSGNPSLASDMVVKGRTLPLWIVGVSPSYTIGNFSASMTWDYKGGHNFYAGQGPDMDFSGISARSAEYGRQRFVFPNSVYQAGTDSKGNPIYKDNTHILISDGNYGFWTGKTTNTGVATNYFVSAAAIRLREVNVTYTLPSKFLKKNANFIKKASLSLIGKNLLMFLPKSNQWGDPEFNYTATGNSMGLSSPYQTPASRFYGATLNVQF